jgi:RNA polymerase sigma-70 factor, ECF subfamily
MTIDPLREHRKRLFGLAYRMLGSRVEAEDVLQDAWLRIAAIDDMREPGPYLTTVVTRLCLDRLRAARARREVYVGPWLPEPLVSEEELPPDAAIELADDISFALLLALERLTPFERAAFLLHDVFDASFAEVSSVLGKSEMACRQLASRARKAVRSERKAPAASREDHQRLFTSFFQAIASGDVDGLKAVLHEDVVMLTDGGGVKIAALNPIRGRDKVARFFIKIAAKSAAQWNDFTSRSATINGLPALLVYFDGELDQVQSIAVDDGKITAIYTVRNPEKLAHIRLH